MNSTLSGQSRDQFLKDNPLVIRIADGPYQGQDIAISSEKCLIRGQHHNRAQCAIFRGPHRTILQDLAGNTRLNGIGIKESSLQVGDSIHCGDLTLRVENLFQKMDDAAQSLVSEPASAAAKDAASPVDSGTAAIADEEEKRERPKPVDTVEDDFSSANRERSQPPAAKPQSEVHKQPDESSSQFLKLHRQLVGQVGKCRKDLIQFGKTIHSHQVELASIKDSSARQFQPVIEQINRQAAKFNQLIKALRHLRTETNRQIDNRLQHFDPAWVKQIADWKNRADQHQQGIAAQVSSLQSRLVELSKKCQADRRQLEILGQAEDPHARIDELRRLTESSIADGSQVLDRVDGLTDSMEQMSALIKQQAQKFNDLDLRLSEIDETVENLDGSTTERLESARQHFEQYTDQSLEPIHRRLETFDDRVTDLTIDSEKQKDQLNQFDQWRSDSTEDAEATKSELENLSQKISEIKSLQQKFDELDLEQRFEDWNQQWERFDGEFRQNKDEVNERLGPIGGLEEKTDHQHQSIDQLNQGQSELKTELADWQAKSDQLAESLGQLQEQVQQQSSAATERVSNHENWLHEIQHWKNESADRESGRYERMEELSNLFEQFRHQYDEQRDSFELRLRSHQESFDSYKNGPESEAQANLRQHCEKLQESIDQLSDQYREHLSDAHSLQERLQTQEQWAEQLQQAGMVSVDDFEEIKNSLTTTSQRVDSFSDLADRYSEIDAQLEEFRSLYEARNEKTLQRVDQQREAFEELKESTVSHQEIHRLQDLFDRLEEKLDTSVRQADDAGDLNQLRGFTAELRTDVDQLKTAFDEHPGQQDFQERLDQFESKIGSLEKDLTTNDEWSSRFAELNEQIPDLRNRLESQAESSADQQKRFNEWTSEQQKHSEKSEECLVELSCKVDDFKSNFEKFQERLQSIEAERNQNDSPVEFSSEQSEILDHRFAEWTNEQKQNSEQHEESFVELNCKVDEFKSRIEEFQKQLQSIEDGRNQDDSVAEFASKQSEMFDQRFAEWSIEQKQNSERAEESFVELSCKVDEFKSRIEEFQKQLQSIENEQNQGDSVTEFRSDELRSQVDDFNSKIKDVQDRLQAIEDGPDQDESTETQPFADQLETLRQSVSRLESDVVTGFKSELTDANQELRVQRDEFNSFGERYQLGQQALMEQIGELHSQMEEQPEWSQLKQEFANILQRFEVLENQFQSQPEHEVNEANEADESAIENDSDLTEEMVRFEHRLDTTNQRIDQFEELGQQFQQLQSEFSNWKSSNLAAAQNELQPAIETHPDDQDEPLVAPGLDEQEPRNTSNPESSDVDETEAEFIRVMQQLTGNNDQEDSQPVGNPGSAPADANSDVSTGETSESSEAGQYQQGQQRAQELDNIYEQAVDSVQSSSAESANPSDQHDESSSDREKVDTDSRLEDILNRLNSNDAWEGVIQQDESETAVAQAGDTQSEVVVENNFADAQVEVVDQPEPSQQSVADVLSRMNVDETWNQEPETPEQTDDASTTENWQHENDSSAATELPAAEAISPTLEPTGEDKEDVSVQDYMSELFGRLRGDEEAEEGVLAPAEKVEAKTSTQPTMPATQIAKPVEVLPLTPAEYVPRQKAPTTNLRALREIANENARKAVSLSDKKRARLTRSLYLGIAVGCVITGCVMLYLTQGNMKMMLVSFGIMAASGYFGLQYFKSNKNEIRLLNKEKQNEKNEKNEKNGEPEAEQNPDDASSNDEPQIDPQPIETEA